MNYLIIVVNLIDYTNVKHVVIGVPNHAIIYRIGLRVQVDLKLM